MLGIRHQISDSRAVYPWAAMAPTINTMKLVATAIATFVSTDKFMILPSPLVFESCLFDRFEFQRADGCHARYDEKEAWSNLGKEMVKL